MIAISSSDIVKKPSYITNPTDITFVKDMKKNITKSVVIPYEIYSNIKESIEYQIWLQKNKGLLEDNFEPELFEDAISEIANKVRYD